MDTVTKQNVFIERHTLDNYQQPIVVKFHDPKLCRLYTDAVNATGSSDLDSENTIQQSQGLEFKTRLEKELDFKKLLERIGLLSRINKKITRTEVLTIGVSLTDKTKVNATDYPWILLQEICTGHCNARDMNIALSTTYPVRQLSDTLSLLQNLELDSDKQISPFDLFLTVYHCCDQMLKQLIFKNLYLCKLAVPFLTDPFCASDSTPLLSVWPLRTLTLESNIGRVKTDLGSTEVDVLDLPSTVVIFARLGRPSFSKSKLLNGLLHDETNITFYNYECPYGTAERTVSDGYVEMFWLPTIKDDRDMFSSPLTFLNVRGDLRLPFCKKVLPFLSNITDILSVIIDIGYLLKHRDEVNTFITNFRNVILIISGSWDIKDGYTVNGIKDFNAIVREKHPSSKIPILLTHEGRKEHNMLKMVSDVSNLMESFLKDTDKSTLEIRLSRLQNEFVTFDEAEKRCMEGKRVATEVIEDILRINKSPQKWKEAITPAQYRYSQRLGDIIKKTHREQNIKKNDMLKQEMQALRIQQVQNVTSAVRLFAGHLVSLARSPICLNYFLAWLKIFIEKEKRKIMPKLIQENRVAWEKLGVLKSMKSPNLADIEYQKKCIENTEKQIQEASFNTDLFFRELGHLYETIFILNIDSRNLGLPFNRDIIHVCASLFIEGNSLELIDGEAFYMPERWIRRVLKTVSNIIGTQTVFSMSVLGLQSSGKSTFLNTMFGSQFPTSAGTCTKGIQMHLLPLKKSLRFQYILIFDTEGLRAPEISDAKYDIDNQLATIITGIGDTTVLNIMGENSSVLRDILQVVVHAFLRLKLADSKIDIRKKCSFVHHNVSSVTAQDKMRPAIFNLVNMLDSVTKEAAEMESISDIAEFNQIIQFDMSSQVWFLPNLWQGFTPMSRINSDYSGQVADIKRKLIQEAIDTKKAYGSLDDVISQARDLWKGILTEDFVFCFRNSLEIRAYNLLENNFLHWSSEMQCFLQEKCVETSQREFAKCRNQKTLDDVASKVNTILRNLHFEKKNDIVQRVEVFFNKNDFGETVRQWKESTKQRFDITCNEILISCKKTTDRFKAKKSFELFQTANHLEHEDKLHKKSMKLAKSLHDQSIGNDEIDRQFEMMWYEFIREIRSKDQEPMIYFFKQRLCELYKNCQSLLDLTKENFDKYIKANSELISLPDIHLDDIHSLVNTAKDDSHVNHALTNIEALINSYCSRPDGLIYDHVVSFLQEVQKEVDVISTNRNVPLEQPLIIKVLVNVSCYASFRFDQHNLDPKTLHSEKILMKDVVCSYLNQLFSVEKQILGQEMNKDSVVVKHLNVFSLKMSSSDISIPQSILKTTKQSSDSNILSFVRISVHSILAQTEAEIDEICKSDTEISESNIKTVLFNVKRAVDALKQHKNEFTVTPRFAIRVCVYVGEYTSFRFQQHNKEYSEEIENRLNKYKESVRARFDAHLTDRKTEDTAALLLSREIDSVARDVIKFFMPGIIKKELKNTLPSIKYDLITAIMFDLAEKERFSLFIYYIENPSEYAEDWIKDKSEEYLFSGNQSVYFNIASRKISEIFKDIYNGIDETTTHFMHSSPQLEEWVDILNKSLKHCQIPDNIIRDAKREITKIPDVTNFKAIILENLKMFEEKLMSETRRETKDTVRWELFDPYEKVFEVLWGCKEQCAYCGEPCFRNKYHEVANLKHQCVQHRPGCCSGIRHENNNTACVETCNYNVQNRKLMHNCMAFNFACNPLKGVSCKDKMHLYVNYRTHLHNWDIEPSTEMTNRSEFWMWFVFKYKEKLADYYEYSFSDIPSSWQHITKESACESVRLLSNEVYVKLLTDMVNISNHRVRFR